MSLSCFQRKYSDSYIAKRGNKNVDIKFSARERFFNNLHQVAQNQKIGKPNHLQFWSNKTKGLKQGSQNRLRSPMPEGGVH